MPTSAAAQTASDQSVIYLNQAWSQDDREWYYHFSQGSAVLSYDIFLNLEVANSQELFRSDANSIRYGLIPEGPNGFNPDGLPIGISKTTVAAPIGEWPAGDYAGMTCAACHEGQLNYEGKHIRIEGGLGNTFEIQAYFQALNAALQATLTDTAKFDAGGTRWSHKPGSQGQVARAFRARSRNDIRICDTNRCIALALGARAN